MTAVLLVAAAGLVLMCWLPSHRAAAGRGGPPSGRLRRAWAAWRATWHAAAPRRGTQRRRRSRAPDVGAVVSEVAARLRSGAPVEQAWTAAVDRVLGPGSPPDVSPAATTDELPRGLRRLAEACRGDAVAHLAVQAVTAATRLSRATGAPLAQVLDRCVETVVEAERAHDARSVALAGPRSTARILTGLPLLGLVLGAGLGADPVATALDGGWGTLSVTAGGVLLYAGARWSAALVRVAQSPVTEQRHRNGTARVGRRGRAGA